MTPLFLLIGFGLLGLQYFLLVIRKKKAQPASGVGASPEEKLDLGQQI